MPAKKKRQLDINDTALTVHIVLDASGSMNSMKDDAIGSVNEFVAGLVKDSPGSRVSLTLFGSTGVVDVFKNQPADAIEPLTTSSYQPSGGTPLYDAIGDSVTALDAATGKNKVMVILTDGQENGSRRVTKQQVKEMLEQRQETNKWLVHYLGANQDAFAEGGQIGTSYRTTMNFANTGGGLRAATRSAFASTMRYGSSGGDLRASAYTDIERLEAGLGIADLDPATPEDSTP